MTELEQQANIADQWNGKPKGDRSDDQDSNGTDDIPDPNGTGGIPEGELSVINDDSPFNIDEDMPDGYVLGPEEEGTHLSMCKHKDQLGGPLQRVPRTNKLILEQV